MRLRTLPSPPRFPTLPRSGSSKSRPHPVGSIFTKQDFLRLQQQFGVNWIIVQGPGVEGLDCPYKNEAVAVCRL